MPVICALWQVVHVRLIGLPRPIELMCATSRSQNWRSRKMSLPRAIDARSSRSASGRSGGMRGRASSTVRTCGTPDRAGCWPARARGRRPWRAARGPADRLPRRGCVRGDSPPAPRRPAIRSRRSRSSSRRRQRVVALLVIDVRADRLLLQREMARVGHQVHADRLAGVGIARGQLARLDVEDRVGRHHVFQVGDRPRPAEHRDRRPLALEPVGRDRG